MAKQERNEVKDQVDNSLQSAGSAIRKGLSNFRNRNKAKNAKRMIRFARGAVKALTAFLKLLFNLILQLWWVILPVLIAVLLFIIANNYIYSRFSTKTSYEDNVIMSESDSPSLGNSLTLLFYTKYSTHSYYYTVDDDNTLYQASDNQTIKDFEGRESMFALNPGALYTLDYYLNDGFISPSQFIKPVYNTCSVGESSGGNCSTKSLTDKNGELVVESVKYKEVKDKDGDIYYQKVDGKNEKGIWNWGLGSVIHYKKFLQESEVHNYHVEQFYVFKRTVKNGKVTIKEEPLTLAEYEKLSNEEKKELLIYNKEVIEKATSSSLPSTIKHGDLEDNGNIPEDDPAHAIDNVASMFGTITNEIELEWVYQNEYENISYVDFEHWYTNPTSSEISNTSLIKKLERKYSSFSEEILTVEEVTVAVEPTQTEKNKCNEAGEKAKNTAKLMGIMSNQELQKTYDKAYNKCISQYGKAPGVRYQKASDSSWVTIEGATLNDFNIKVKYTASLPIIKTGQLMKHTVSYVEDNPNISDDAGLGYLKDYISNYETYTQATVDGDNFEEDKYVTDKYYCYTLKDGSLSSKVLSLNGTDQEMVDSIWNELSLDILVEATKKKQNPDAPEASSQQMYLEDGVFTTDVDRIATSPSECPKNTVAIKMTDTVMSEMYSNDLPDLQTLTIMKELGFNATSTDSSIITSTALGYETITETGLDINSSSNEDGYIGDNSGAESIMTKYKEEIRQASSAYGVDANLIYAIIEATSNGDEEYNRGYCKSNEGCGLMGIKINNFEGGANLSAFNFMKNERVTFARDVHDSTDYMSPENNIRYGAMLLQRYMEKYDYNQLLAIQAYTYGEANMDKFIKYYIKSSGTDKDYILEDDVMYEWTAYREYCNQYSKKCFGTEGEYGEEKFIEKVLTSLGTVSEVSIRGTDKNYHTFNFEYLKDLTVDEDTGAITALNNRIMNMYLRKGGEKYWSKYWDVLYAGQSSWDDGLYSVVNTSNSGSTTGNLVGKYTYDDLPNKAEKHEYKFRENQSDVESVIYTMFGFTENMPTDAYTNLSDEYWKTRFSAMFKTAGSKAWTSNYDISKTFNDTVVLPVNDPFITEHFGWQNRGNNAFTYSDTSTIFAIADTPVVAMSSGKVVDVVKNGSETLITIVHNDGTGKLQTEDKKDKDSEKEESLTTSSTNVTGRWKDVEDMGYTKEKVISIIKEKYTDVKKNSVLKGKAEYFVNYCQKKDINPFLVASISAQESGYGTSNIAVQGFNFGGMEANHKDAVGSIGRWAKFESVEAGIRAHIDLLSQYYVNAGLYLPSTMAPKYCEGSSSWVVAVNTIYSEITGHIYEEATQARHQTVKKYVAFTYYGLDNIKVKKGDIVSSGDAVGYVGNENSFKMSFMDGDSYTDIGAVFQTMQSSMAREMMYMAVGGVTGANNIGVDLSHSAFGAGNPYDYVGQCTWYAWGRTKQVTGVSLGQWGHAKSWCESAKSSGYKVGTTPSNGAVIVWSGGTYGHVGFVEEYTEDGQVTFSEGNYNNPCNFSGQVCDMVEYAQKHPGELLHKATMDEYDVRTYTGLNLLCYIYTD